MKTIKSWSALLVISLLTFAIFRPYFFQNLVPFPANLLQAFYQPWKSYPTADYPVGPPHKSIGYDNLRSFYPTRTLVLNALKEGRLPLWNPHSFAGNTLLGVYQSAVFHPLSWLFFILPMIDAWSIIIILTPIISGLGTYWWLRTLTLTRIGATFGAITFAFSGMMIVWWQEMFMATSAIITLPLALVGIENYLTAPKLRWWLLLIFALTFSILSGWFQNTFYLFGLTIAYTLFRLWQKPKHSSSEESATRLTQTIFILFGFISAVGLSAIHLLPAVEAYLHSARPATDASGMLEEFLAPLVNLVTFIAPDFFGNPGVYTYHGPAFYHELVIWIGIPAFILLVISTCNWKKQLPVERFFLISGLLTLSLGFKFSTTWFFLHTLRLPFISEMTPGRIFFASSFCLAVAASFSLERWLTEKSPATKKALVLSSGLLLITWLLAPLVERGQYPEARLPVRLRNLVLPSIWTASSIVTLLIFEKINKLRWVGGLLLIGISLVGILYFTQKYLYFSERRFVFPTTPVEQELQNRQGINRFWSYGDGQIMRNLANQLRLYSPEGYESFNIRRYNELSDAAHKSGQLTSQIARADTSVYPARDMTDLAENFYRRRFLDLVGVRLIAALHDEKESLIAARIKLPRIWTDGVYDLFENQQSLPRIAWFNNYLIETEPQKILDRLFDPNFDINRQLILETAPSVATNLATGTATLVSYQPETIQMQSESTAAGILFLSDNFYPGWTATIDDQPTPIYRANYTFRAVVVPAGKHEVKFIYQPLSVKLGLIISAVSLLMVGIYLKKSNRAKPVSGGQ